MTQRRVADFIFPVILLWNWYLTSIWLPLCGSQPCCLSNISDSLPYRPMVELYIPALLKTKIVDFRCTPTSIISSNVNNGNSRYYSLSSCWCGLHCARQFKCILSLESYNNPSYYLWHRWGKMKAQNIYNLEVVEQFQTQAFW